jgi:hypothetical protein
MAATRIDILTKRLKELEVEAAQVRAELAQLEAEQKKATAGHTRFDQAKVAPAPVVVAAVAAEAPRTETVVAIEKLEKEIKQLLDATKQKVAERTSAQQRNDGVGYAKLDKEINDIVLARYAKETELKKLEDIKRREDVDRRQAAARIAHQQKLAQEASAGAAARPAAAAAGIGVAAARPITQAVAAAPAPIRKAVGDIASSLNAIQKTYDALSRGQADEKNIREPIKKIIEATPNVKIRMERHNGVMVPIIRPQDGTPDSTRAAKLLADLLALYQVEIMRPDRNPGYVLYTKRYSEQEQKELLRPDRGLDLKDIMTWYPELRTMVDTKSAKEFLESNVTSLKDTGVMFKEMGEDFILESLQRDVEVLHFIVHGERLSASDILDRRNKQGAQVNRPSVR